MIRRAMPAIWSFRPVALALLSPAVTRLPAQFSAKIRIPGAFDHVFIFFKRNYPRTCTFAHSEINIKKHTKCLVSSLYMVWHTIMSIQSQIARQQLIAAGARALDGSACGHDSQAAADANA
jgi:hypothetical protein